MKKQLFLGALLLGAFFTSPAQTLSLLRKMRTLQQEQLAGKTAGAFMAIPRKKMY
ncbi:hypothetical protein [Flavobacterium zepuense]|uniref:hypothetical protein n=1 Tax=Flavobacterium zepuense TaxID=2593302 RepID=UPI00163D8A94|nr:hypothetical protein [Flavobacterium zepuense]